MKKIALICSLLLTTAGAFADSWTNYPYKPQLHPSDTFLVGQTNGGRTNFQFSAQALLDQTGTNAARIIGAQAGRTNATGATSLIITFPSAMPSTNYTAHVIGVGAALASEYVSAKTTNNFTITMSAFTGSLDWSVILHQ